MFRGEICDWRRDRARPLPLWRMASVATALCDTDPLRHERNVLWGLGDLEYREKITLALADLRAEGLRAVQIDNGATASQ